MGRFKGALICIAIFGAIAAYVWLDNRNLQSWAPSIIAGAEGDDLVLIKGTELERADIVNPISWFSPHVFQLWFMPKHFIGADRERGKNFAVSVVRFSQDKPHRQEVVIVYSPDRKSSVWFTPDEAEEKLKDGDLEFRPNKLHLELHEGISRLTAP